MVELTTTIAVATLVFLSLNFVGVIRNVMSNKYLGGDGKDNTLAFIATGMYLTFLGFTVGHIVAAMLS